MPSSWGELAWDPLARRAWLFEPPSDTEDCQLWSWENDEAAWVRERAVPCDATYDGALAYFDSELKEVVVGFANLEGRLTLQSIGQRRVRRTVQLPRALRDETSFGFGPLHAAYAPGLGLLLVSERGTWAIKATSLSRVARGKDVSSVVWDDAEQRLVGLTFDGSGTWALKGGTWRRIAAHTHYTGTKLGWDHRAGKVIQFVADPDDNDSNMLLSELDGGEWRKRVPVVGSLVTSGARVLVTARGTLLFGGQDFRVYGAPPTNHTWRCTDSGCEEEVPPFVPPQAVDTSIVAVDGRVIHVSLGALEFHAFGAEGWEPWAHGRALRADRVAFEATELGSRPLSAGGGSGRLTLLDWSGRVWQTQPGRELTAVAEPTPEFSDWLHRVSEVHMMTEPESGRLVVVADGRETEAAEARTAWALKDGTWTSFEAPELEALVATEDGLHGLTLDLRVVALEDREWIDALRMKIPQEASLPKGLVHAGGRFYTTLKGALVAILPGGFERIAALPCEREGTLAHDLPGRRLLYVCDKDRGVYAMPLLNADG